MKHLFCLSLIPLIISTASKAQNFSNEYIAANKGNWSIEMPEVQELVHIVMAITPVGMADSNLVEHRTNYYREVISHFSNFKNHEVVQRMNNLLPGRYARLKMDACGFYFDETGRIQKDRTYKSLSWSRRNEIEPFVASLEDFSRQSGFREFFTEHMAHYDHLKTLLGAQISVDKQWQWLETQFDDRYDHYRIFFSPLVNGSHSTNRFASNGFRQTAMFINGPIERSSHDRKTIECLMTRSVFTEIDHNYVNPVSDRFMRKIRSAFRDRSKWAAGKNAASYPTAYTVFNEYMTWAVFSIYLLEHYDECHFQKVNGMVERQMAQYRGFIKFPEFNRELIHLWRSRAAGTRIVDLYPSMLEWCANQ